MTTELRRPCSDEATLPDNSLANERLVAEAKWAILKKS